MKNYERIHNQISKRRNGTGEITVVGRTGSEGERMNEQQYKKYKEIYEELKPINDFLFWCGKDKGSQGYLFNIMYKVKTLFLHRKACFSRNEGGMFEISKDLQERIVKVIEEYVQEKEKELKEL